MTKLFKCRTCGNKKPRTEQFWHREKTAADGFRSDCKPCRNAYRGVKHHEYMKDPKYRERRSKQSNDWYYDNHDYACDRNRKRSARPEIKQRRREYEVERRERDPDYIESNREKCTLWYHNNKQRHKEFNARWRAEHPDLVAQMAAAHNSNRRTRVLNAKGKFTAADIRQKLEEQEHACFWCGNDMPKGTHTVDHYIPLSRGGTNWPDNIVLACAPCNGSKHNKLPDEFIAYRKKYRSNPCGNRSSSSRVTSTRPRRARTAKSSRSRSADRRSSYSPSARAVST